MLEFALWSSRVSSTMACSLRKVAAREHGTAEGLVVEAERDRSLHEPEPPSLSHGRGDDDSVADHWKHSCDVSQADTLGSRV